MANYLTSSSLIAAVKRDGIIPSSQSTFSDADMLAIANRELKISMMPSILIYHQEYYVRDTPDIAIVANQNNYAIPYRASGSKFREVFYKNTTGQLASMTRIDPDNRAFFQQLNFQNNYVYFYLQGNDVVLQPDVGSNPVGSLMFSYYMRPNDLVDESRISTILNISVGASTTVYTVDNIPTNLTSFVQDGITLTAFSTSAKLDILQRRPGHKTIVFDISPTAIDTVGKTITFNNSDLGSSTIVGDYIAFAGECIIPQIPTDLHPVLVERVIQVILKGLGDQVGYGMVASKIQEMEKETGNLIDNRSEGTPQKVNNLGGLLRSSKLRRRGWL